MVLADRAAGCAAVLAARSGGRACRDTGRRRLWRNQRPHRRLDDRRGGRSWRSGRRSEWRWRRGANERYGRIPVSVQRRGRLQQFAAGARLSRRGRRVDGRLRLYPWIERARLAVCGWTLSRLVAGHERQLHLGTGLHDRGLLRLQIPALDDVYLRADLGWRVGLELQQRHVSYPNPDRKLPLDRPWPQLRLRRQRYRVHLQPGRRRLAALVLQRSADTRLPGRLARTQRGLLGFSSWYNVRLSVGQWLHRRSMHLPRKRRRAPMALLGRMKRGQRR
jgi:hypothetical protein